MKGKIIHPVHPQDEPIFMITCLRAYGPFMAGTNSKKSGAIF
jgi:hypothetical protein